jgi:NTP pyrophosphatase (non-canonical NTP hydrolase)
LHKTAVDKGFWPDGINDNVIGTKIALIHSEASELLEAVRKDMGAGKIADEIADIIIRTLDLYEGMREGGIITRSINDALVEKAEFNKTRPERHGNRF